MDFEWMPAGDLEIFCVCGLMTCKSKAWKPATPLELFSHSTSTVHIIFSRSGPVIFGTTYQSLGSFFKKKRGGGSAGKLPNDLKAYVFDFNKIMDAEGIKMEITTAKIWKKVCIVK